jgi:putative ABC transport system substrate-binding protein
MMRRRELIAAVGLLPIALEGSAHAQQSERMRRIGFLTGGSAGPGDALVFAETRSLVEGLRQLGWAEGRNIEIEYRFSDGQPERVRANAKELVGLGLDVILSTGGPMLSALIEETRTIPIVFTVIADPVGRGYVKSLAHPGGNVTGFSVSENEIAGKWLELLKEVAPQITRALVLLHVDAGQRLLADAVVAAAPWLGITLATAAIHDYAEAELAVEAFAKEPNGGLVVFSNIVMATPPERGPMLAARYRLPAVYSYPIYAKSGGLVSYGSDPVAQLRDAAGYVDRILRGEKPGDLPVQQPTKFSLVINLKTATALGITVPPPLLARADEVIE